MTSWEYQERIKELEDQVEYWKTLHVPDTTSLAHLRQSRIMNQRAELRRLNEQVDLLLKAQTTLAKNADYWRDTLFEYRKQKEAESE